MYEGRSTLPRLW